MNRRVAVSMLGLVLALCGCGPVVPLELAMRQQQVDVKYGHPHPQPSTSPLPPVVLPAPFTFIPEVPTVEPAPSAPAVVSASPPPACGQLGTIAVPRDPATATIAGAPPRNNYVMRSGGTYALASTKGALPAALGLFQPSAPVKGSDQTDGAWEDYSLVTSSDASHYTAFTFRLAPNNAATPGILLTSLHWRDPVRGNLDFVPDQQPLQFLQTPVAIGNSWTSAGGDPIDQTSVELQGSIIQKDTVNACGTPLDSYRMHVAGNIASPTFQLAWTADYDIGTQYGGLILAEHVNLGGPDRVQNTGDSYSYDETSTINSVPPITTP